MSKADYIAMAGVVLLAAGFGCMWWPLALVVAGAYLLRLARVIPAPKKAE